MSVKPVITLISDWKMRDPYVAMLKGRLLAAAPEAALIDITHAIDFSSVNQTAFILQHSFKQFPDETIHLILTNYSAISNVIPVVVAFEHHYFIGEDNGIFCLMFGQDCPLEGRRFAVSDDTDNPIDLMISLVKALLEHRIEEITEPYRTFRRAYVEQPLHSPHEHLIEGKIVYIDGYYNAVTNIPVKMFKDIVQNKTFLAKIKSKNEWKINAFHERYCNEEEFYFVPNALGCLEITLYQGNVAILADLQIDDKVIIEYEC